MSAQRPPAGPGYRMPAEWEPHEATWIAWPHNRSDWPGKFAAIEWVYADIVRNLARGENVRILVNGAGAEKRARKVLSSSATHMRRVEFFRVPTDRGWTRDYGPLFVRQRTPTRGAELAATTWGFNGWAKYRNHKKDAAAAAKICEALKMAAIRPEVAVGAGRAVTTARMVLEGGSIDVNGTGTLLTTEECLLSTVQQRNPGTSKRQIEEAFAKYLGASNVIWLRRGIAGDDTHGHVDDIARFVAPDTVVAAVEKDRKDPNHAPLQENLKILRTAVTEEGRRLVVVELPLPAPVVFEGQRLPASYANFYIGNEAVLVPTFNDANDRVALNTLAELFPRRRAVGIHCGDLIWGLGAIHCMTQQQPTV